MLARGARAAALGLLLLATVAAAQSQGPLLEQEFTPPSDRGRNTSVLDRERPEFEARGIRQGTFLVFPKLEVGAAYSSNVFGLSNRAIGDAFLTVDPSLSVQSQWSTHSLSVNSSARIRRFATETPKNETGFQERLDGRIDFDRRTTLAGGTVFERLYEQRSSGSFPADALASSSFYRTKVFGRLAREEGSLRSILAADYTHLTFDNVAALNGGVLDQKERNRDVLLLTGRVDYALTPDASVFGDGSYSTIDYQRRLLTGADNRDGDEMRISGGASFDLTALVRVAVAAGYVRRRFYSALYGGFGGLTVEARVEYFVSQLTTLSATARRYVEESDFVGSGVYYSSALSFGVDHELQRNLLLNVHANYEIDDFQSVARRDDIMSATAGARYFAGQGWGLRSEVAYLKRNSDDPRQGIRYDEFKGALSLILQR